MVVDTWLAFAPKESEKVRVFERWHIVVFWEYYVRSHKSLRENAT